MKLENISYYMPGTGIAGANFSIPILYLRNDSHNYYTDERLENYAQDKYSISISKFDDDLKEFPVSSQKLPIYMTVFMDLNKNKTIDFGEVELFILNFK